MTDDTRRLLTMTAEQYEHAHGSSQVEIRAQAARVQALEQENAQLKHDNEVMLMAEASPLDKLPGLDELTDALVKLPEGVTDMVDRIQELEQERERIRQALVECVAIIETWRQTDDAPFIETICEVDDKLRVLAASLPSAGEREAT
jgi:DNA repair exonuclease SbcCD ATPase subunit